MIAETPPPPIRRLGDILGEFDNCTVFADVNGFKGEVAKKLDIKLRCRLESMEKCYSDEDDFDEEDSVEYG